MYYTGQGVPQDYAQALAWFRKAAEQGNAEAKSNLSKLEFAQPSAARGTQAEQATRPKTEAATAQGVSTVPGAIVCQDLKTVNFMFDWYQHHWADAFRDQLMPEAQLVTGPSTPNPEPHLKRYGCTLLPHGTPMTVEYGHIVPIVSAKLANGKIIRGVTSPAMIGK